MSENSISHQRSSSGRPDTTERESSFIEKGTFLCGNVPHYCRITVYFGTSMFHTVALEMEVMVTTPSFALGLCM